MNEKEQANDQGQEHKSEDQKGSGSDYTGGTTKPNDPPPDKPPHP